MPTSTSSGTPKDFLSDLKYLLEVHLRLNNIKHIILPWALEYICRIIIIIIIFIVEFCFYLVLIMFLLWFCIFLSHKNLK